MKGLNAADPVPKIGHTACHQFQSISPRKVRLTELEKPILKMLDKVSIDTLSL